MKYFSNILLQNALMKESLKDLGQMCILLESIGTFEPKIQNESRDDPLQLLNLLKAF